MRKLILFAIIGLSAITPLAFAQTITIPDGFEIKDEQILIVVLIGVIAGGVRVGINTLNDETSTTVDNIKKINNQKVLGNFISVVLASIPIGITSAFTVDLNALGYIVIFFTVYGAGAVAQNFVKGVSNNT